jgi:hypothetical protein
MFEELHDTVTKEDFRIPRESIDADVSRLDRALSGLAEAQARTEATVTDLVVGQKQLFEAQARTEANLAHLDATVAKLTEAQTSMATALQRLTIRTDDVVERTFELQFRGRLTAYLGRFLRRGKLVPNERLLDQIEPHLSDREVDDVLRADVIASGLVDGEPTSSWSRSPGRATSTTSSVPTSGPNCFAGPGWRRSRWWPAMPSRRNPPPSRSCGRCGSGSTAAW